MENSSFKYPFVFIHQFMNMSLYLSIHQEIIVNLSVGLQMQLYLDKNKIGIWMTENRWEVRPGQGRYEDWKIGRQVKKQGNKQTETHNVRQIGQISLD